MNATLLVKLREMSEEDIYRGVYCDAMTRLQNRRAFMSTNSKFVACVDLDSLKYINDSLGHAAGDAAIISLGEHLAGVFGYNKVFRLGGDEFAVRNSSVGETEYKLNKLRAVIPGFSYGVGVDLAHADSNLLDDKARRERVGMRVGRGVCPPWARRLK